MYGVERLDLHFMHYSPLGSHGMRYCRSRPGLSSNDLYYCFLFSAKGIRDVIPVFCHFEVSLHVDENRISMGINKCRFSLEITYLDIPEIFLQHRKIHLSVTEINHEEKGSDSNE